MSKQYPADTVGIDGKVYPTVGENIRESAKNSVTPQSLYNALKDSEEITKVTSPLDVTASELKTAIVNLLTGKTIYFGGLSVSALSSDQLKQIKEYLGISQGDV